MTEEEWIRIRNGIFAGESGGDYDALFGFSNREGKRFAGKRLTDMTVDEAIAFSQPDGEYGQWVKGQIGRVATPMGAYQVVGTTLRAAKEAMGLRGDERMDQATQDRIGKWILAAQGTGAWEGYRGPRDAGPEGFRGGVSSMPDYARGALGGSYGGKSSEGLPSRDMSPADKRLAWAYANGKMTPEDEKLYEQGAQEGLWPKIQKAAQASKGESPLDIYAQTALSNRSPLQYNPVGVGLRG